MRTPNLKTNRILQCEVTTVCDLDCFDCTRALAQSPKLHMPLDLFEQAVVASKDWILRENGTFALFGGNPSTWKYLERGCEILAKHLPEQNRGYWSNALIGKGEIVSKFFGPSSYVNAVLHGQSDKAAEFQKWMPWAKLHGIDKPSMHASIFVAAQDFLPDDDALWRAVDQCSYDITWSAIIMLEAPAFNTLGGYSCEIAGTHARVNGKALGVPIVPGWLDGTVDTFRHQYQFACPRCGGCLNLEGVPDLGATSADRFSKTNANIIPLTISKKRRVEMVKSLPEHDKHKPIDYLHKR